MTIYFPFLSLPRLSLLGQLYKEGNSLLFSQLELSIILAVNRLRPWRAFLSFYHPLLYVISNSILGIQVGNYVE